MRKTFEKARRQQQARGREAASPQAGIQVKVVKLDQLKKAGAT